MSLNIMPKMLASLKESVREYRRYKRLRYKIVDDRLDQHRIMFTCRLLRSTFTLQLHEAVHDIKLVGGLSSSQACWLGIQYGQSVRRMNDKKKSVNSLRYPFQLKRNLGRYQISHVNRDGELCFLDRVSRNEQTKDPRAIVKSQHFVGEFDPVQACYIGILAGVSSVTH